MHPREPARPTIQPHLGEKVNRDGSKGTHLITQLARTSLTPSMPPVPSAPPALPSAAHKGAMGSRMLARKATNSDCESVVEICCKRRLDDEAAAILL